MVREYMTLESVAVPGVSHCVFRVFGWNIVMQTYLKDESYVCKPAGQSRSFSSQTIQNKIKN